MQESKQPIGRVLKDTYRIDEYLGEGGPSVVYKGTDIILNVKVAIKELKDKSENNITSAERFLKEARTQARLVHQNIVGIRSMIEEDDDSFIVMEYIKGKDLSKLLWAEKPSHQLPLEQVASLFRQILNGLSYAHQNGVVHRDIKPSNIIVTEDWKVKIADFGIAHAVQDQRLTQPGILVGTLIYISPEQLQGRAFDHRCDIYSVGITLYEALAGQPPFGKHGEEITNYEMMSKHLFTQPPPLQTYRPNLPQALEQVVQKSLAKEPTDRFASCEEFAQALDQALYQYQNQSSSALKAINSHSVPFDAHSRTASSEELRPDELKSLLSQTQLPSLGSSQPAQVGTASAAFPRNSFLPPATQAPGTQAHQRNLNAHSVSATSQPLPLNPIKEPSVEVALEHSQEQPFAQTGIPQEQPLAQTGIPQEQPFNFENTKANLSSKLFSKFTLVGLLLLGILGGWFFSSMLAQKPEAITSHSDAATKPRTRVVSKVPIVRKYKPDPPKDLRGGTMQFIPSGSYTQGNGKNGDLVPTIWKTQLRPNDHPARRVQIRSFWIDLREVRVKDYKECVQEGSCQELFITNSKTQKQHPIESKLKATQPMSYIPWQQALQFCMWAGKRLPTEAEWEFAARSSKNNLYPWGSKQPECKQANRKDCSKQSLPSLGTSRAQGKSDFGVLDMSGNVWEWTHDCYNTQTYKLGRTVDPRHDTFDCQKRVLRGGSFLLPKNSAGLTTYYRHSLTEEQQSVDVGFRCALTYRKSY